MESVYNESEERVKLIRYTRTLMSTISLQVYIFS